MRVAARVVAYRDAAMPRRGMGSGETCVQTVEERGQKLPHAQERAAEENSDYAALPLTIGSFKE